MNTSSLVGGVALAALTALAATAATAATATAQTALRTFTATFGAGAGDVNKDGVPDLILANGDTATVISGKDWSTLHTLKKAAFGNNVVTAVDGGADLDQDGHDDVIVGRQVSSANSTKQQQGVVRAWSGKDGKLLFEHFGLWGHDNLGCSVAALGDLNKDGFPEFGAGAESGPAQQPYGLVLVWSGKDGRLLYLFTGDSQSEGLGHSLRPAGDIDKDGFPDIVSGANNRGVARVYSGSTGKQLYEFRPQSSAIRIAVDGVGDINKDGFDDVIVGGSSSAATVYSGKDGSILHTLKGTQTDDMFGWAVAGGLDLNADGYPDFLVGAPGFENQQSNKINGYVRAFSGKDGSTLFTIQGTALSSRFGSWLSDAGDVNGDGVRDFLVAAEKLNQVTLYSGDTRSLSVDKVELSIAQGGQQKMFLNAGSKHGLKPYLIMGSEKGTTPGTRFGPILVPLNSSTYFLFTLNSPNTVIQGSLGSLDTTGKASAVLTLPKKIPPSLVGVTVHHAYMAVTLAPWSFDFVSNPVRLKLLK